MDIEKIAKEIHEVNISKGFWDDRDTKNVGEVLMLCVSELSEALEAHRKNHKCSLNEKVKNEVDIEHIDIVWFETHVKNTFEDEIADTVIRLLDLSEGFGIDLAWHIKAKLAYNKTRPHKHGKAY